MIAAKQFDPVLGVDIHIVQPPGPVPPVPIPHPFVGMVLDPMDFIPVIGGTVMVNGIPRATAGSAGIAAPPHIPIGGVFVKPPGNECEVFMGSATVLADDEPLSRLGMPALSCHDIGMPSPPRLKKKSKPRSLFLPTSVVLSIPTGRPVVVGGPPTVSLMAIGTRLGLSMLGKGLKKLRKAKGFKRLARRFKKARQKAFRNLKPGFLKCTVLRAEPVDVVTGGVVVDQEDFSIPARIPITWTRHYGSRSERRGVCGHGWETPADARLAFEEDGSVTFYDGTAAPTYFPSVPDMDPVRELVDGASLWRSGESLVVSTKGGLAYWFPVTHAGSREAVVSRLQDASGQFLRFDRDQNGLCRIVESAGRIVEVSSADGLIGRMDLRYPDAPGAHALVSFQYDDAGNLVAVRDALGAPYRFAYSGRRLVRHTDRNGLSFHYEYDAPGRCVHAWGDGGLYDYRFTYQEQDRRTAFADSLGHPWQVRYDHLLQITEETDPLGGVTRYVYDDAGRTTSVTDPEGNRTAYEYDVHGNLLRLERPDGGATLFVFDAADRLVQVTDPAGGTWTQEWNERGLLARQRSPTGAGWEYEYDSSGGLVGVTTPRKGRLSLAADAYGNVARIIDALGQATTFSYDALGNIAATTDPAGQRTYNHYDAKGRAVRFELASGAAIACAYDAGDNLVLYQDENGGVTQLEYCGLGEVRRRRQPDGEVVEYHYDTEENLTGVTNQRGERYRIARDPLGRIVEETDFWGRACRYTYSMAGHLAQKADALGRVTRYEVDCVGRLRRKVDSDPARPRDLRTETFEYDANGNVTACENDVIRVERVFDAEGRLVEERQGGQCTVTNEYDLDGNRTTRTVRLQIGGYRSTSTARFEYDLLNELRRVEIGAHGAVAITRDTLGQITRESFGGHVSRSFAYHPDGYVAAQRAVAFGRSLFDQAYQYDRSGNLVAKRDSVLGFHQYAYDPLGRLLAHIDSRGNRRPFPTDAAGDPLVPHSPGESGSTAPGRSGTLDGRSYLFDAAGCLVERVDAHGTTRFAWDADQRLCESHRGDRITRYEYDPFGRRVRKGTEGEAALFFWDGDVLLADAAVTDPSGAGGAPRRVREWVCYPGAPEPLAVREATPGQPAGTACYLYCNDPNGCPNRLLDASGGVLWLAEHGAWGALNRVPIAHVDNPLRFLGQYHDEETGLCYNRHRYFDPCLGEFVSPDPLGLEAGERLYRYAPNGLVWVDPLGLNCFLKTLSSIKGSVGPLKQWIRIGPSYSHALKQYIALSIRWGASPAHGGKYLKQIGDLRLQAFNQWLRAKRIPLPGWRFKDPGHFHLKK